MMERDFLIRWRFIGSEDTADDVGAWCSAADVGEFGVIKGFDEGVEMGGGLEREVTEEDRAGVVEEGFEIGFVGFDCVCCV